MDEFIKLFEKTCDVIKKCNIRAYDDWFSSENLRFGFDRVTMDNQIKPVKVRDVFEYEGVRMCEVEWNKPITNEADYTDFVYYYEFEYRRPDLLIEWFEKKFKDAPKV